MLHIHRAERADGLVEMLGDLVAAPLADAMVAEVVAVPTRGIERWLTQQLSLRLGAGAGRTDGVCANMDFPFPGRLVGAALAGASGVDPETDPWQAARSVWPLLEVVDECLPEPWLAPLASHLRNAGPAGESRRLAAVRHLADLYDRYGVHRPQMLRAWAEGGDAPASAGDRWQAELWRHLRRRIGTPSPAERLEESCDRLRVDADLVGLPERVSLFGLTRLPASYLEVLGAMSVTRDIHVFALHPSPALWDRVAARPLPTSLLRVADPTTADVANPLLASWGRDVREMQLVLRAGVGGEGWVDHHGGGDAVVEGATLLGRVQADVRADRRPEADARPELDPDDHSIWIHACHGRARQVEVLRDAILHLLAGDPELEPRDIIVMCPDIETFAPLIHATFGATEDDSEVSSDVGMPDLRVRLADRSLRQTNPLLGTVAQLLDLATARITVTQLLDLAGRQPVGRRFGFNDDDLARVEEWVAAAGIRWGLDGAHRAPWEMQRLSANTWRSGLDRILLGVAMADEGQRRWGGVLPLDDVDSGDIDLAGRLAEFVDRVAAAVTALRGLRPVAEWAAALADAADSLTETSGAEAWQRAQLSRLLDDVVAEATSTSESSGALLGVVDIVGLLGDRLKGRPTGVNFRTGHLTICTLVPMRSVPHKVVCLLGIDDGVFPRGLPRDGDDLILAAPQIGDRDSRSEDRQLLLDALLAATHNLVITYTGRDERTNAYRPPAVPVGELLDLIDATVSTADGSRARHGVVVHHPLQPFDSRNFDVGALVGGRPWSFDTVNLSGAQAARRARPRATPFLDAPLPDLDTRTVELDQLERFVRHPVGAFLRRRLGVTFADFSHDPDDALPIDLDGLQEWQVGERLLAARLAGADPQACVAAERARGLLPPGALAAPILNRIGGYVEDIVGAARLDDPARSLDVNVTLADGTSIVGSVPDVRGDLIHRITYSRLAPSHRLVAWVRLLALTAARPERPLATITIGRARSEHSRRRISTAAVEPLAVGSADRATIALSQLASLVDLYRRAMREPLPLYDKTSAAWAEAVRLGRPPEDAAARQWTSDQFAAEDADPAHVLVLGGVAPIGALLADGPRPDERTPLWDPDESTRLGHYARRLWDGLLAFEEVTDR